MSLTVEKVAAIKGMIQRGDRHMDVATYFGINQARVSEIKLGRRAGRKFAAVKPCLPENLPPPGPYVVVAKTEVDSLVLEKQVRQRLVRELELLLASIRLQVTDTNVLI